MFVGEAPWRDEVAQQEPFVGPAGRWLNRACELAGIDRRSVFITNAVHCRPAELGEEHIPKSVIEHCREVFLAEEILAVRPKVIVALGNIAMKSLARKAGMGRHHGIPFPLTLDWAGEHQTTMIASYHPSYVRRNPAAEVLLTGDLAAAKRALDHSSGSITDYRAFASPDEILADLDRFARLRRLALDVETTSLDDRVANLLCVAFSPKAGVARVWHMIDEKGEPISWAVRRDLLIALYALIHSGILLYGHNFKFDLRMLRQLFLRTLGKDLDLSQIRWRDTMLMANLVDENLPAGLKDWARLCTTVEYTAQEIETVRAGLITKASLDARTLYAAKDVDATIQLARALERRLKEEELWEVYDFRDDSDMITARNLLRMEIRGVPIHGPTLDHLDRQIRRRLSRLTWAIRRACGDRLFNPRSYEQVQDLLYQKLRLPQSPHKTGKGKPGTGEEALDWLVRQTDHPIPKLLLLYRKYGILKRNFVDSLRDALDGQGRVHPHWNPLTATGRVVSDDPNIENLPLDRELEPGRLISIRDVVRAQPGWVIISADYSQIEYKCAALIAGDEKLIRQLFDEGLDIHAVAVEAIYGNDPDYQELKRRMDDAAKAKLKEIRKDVKGFNFGRLYGGSNEGVAENTGLPLDKVELFAARMDAEYPGLARYIRVIPELAIKEGVVVTPFGRKRHLPAGDDTYVKRKQGRRALIAGPQSAAAHICRRAYNRICHEAIRRGLRGFPVNLIYDEIWVESPDDEVDIWLDLMTNEMTRPVPELDNRSFSIEIGVGQTVKEADRNKQPYRRRDTA